jgi:hypothetical protein
MMRTTKNVLASAILLACLVFVSPAFGQKDATSELGFHPQKLYDFQNVDNVNLFNGNLIVTLPMGLRYPVSSTFGYQLSLVYNSKIWDYEVWYEVDGDSSVRREWVYPNLRSDAGLGWRLSLGRLLPPTETTLESSPKQRPHFVYESPAGDEHAFGAAGTSSFGQDVLVAISNESGDLSGLRLVKISNTASRRVPKR